MKIDAYLSRLKVPERLTVVVTGGNSGVGFAFCEHVLKYGWRVILAVRSTERGQKAKEKLLGSFPDACIEVAELDVSERSSISAFCASLIKNKQDVHAFYCNAGVYRIPFALTDEGIEMTCATNFLGNVLLFRLLESYFRSLDHQVRFILTTSIVARFAKFKEEDFFCKERYNKAEAYARSKVAINQFFVWLVERCQNTNILPLLVHPGITYTPLISKAYPGRKFQIAARRFVRMACHKPKKAALTAVLAVSADVDAPCLIGPRGPFHISGFPKRYRLYRGNLKNTAATMGKAYQLLDIEE